MDDSQGSNVRASAASTTKDNDDDDQSFILRAEETAERHLREWIRRTFRETFLQAMSSQLSNGNHRHETSTLTMPEMQGCMEVVKRLSNGWQRRLIDERHGRTANWIQSVWETGQEDLWTVEWTLERFKQMKREMSNEDCDDPTTKATAEPQALDVESHNQSSTDQVVDESTTPPPRGDEMITIPYCELRKMGRAHSCEDDDKTGTYNNERTLTKLKQMGETGESYWLLDHEIVDQAAKEIPKRQRWEKRGPSSRGSNKLKQPVAKIRQQSGANDSGDDDMQDRNTGMPDDTSVTSNPILTAVLNRGRSKLRAPKSKRRRTQSAPAPQAETPRPPSTLATASLSGKEDLTVEEKQELDRTMIHPDEEEDQEDTPMAGIFGVLQDVGKIQEREREAEKRQQGRKTMDQMTDKQRRRQERAYIKERLAPHRLEKNQDPQKYRSKILRTEQDCEDGTTKHFLEFDLGWSLVEYEDNGERRLMAFDGIQACLEELAPTIGT